METLFDFHIADGTLQEQVRSEVMRGCPEITALEFGRQVQVISSEPVDRVRIEAIIVRVRYLSRSIVRDLLYEFPYSPINHEDPFPHLDRTRQVVKVSDGQYLVQGEFLDLMRALDTLVVELAHDLGACEQDYPSFVPVDLLKRINYFKDFSHHIMVVAPLCGKPEALERFAARHDYPHTRFETLATGGLLEDARLVAAPSVCYTCYYALRNQQLAGNQIVTAKNRCSRNEPAGFSPLRRLNNFTMREIIFLGDRGFVVQHRQKMLEVLRGLMDSLGMAGKIESANDLFFSNDAAYKAVFQHSLKLKHEWLAYLPFCKEYSAICSVNLHNDSFGKAFGVTLGDGTPMQSACIGFGLERWAFSILCQFGWDRGKWPDSLRRRLS